RIGAGEIAAIGWLPAFIEAAATALPRVAWTVEVDLTLYLRQRLETQALDIAFLVGPVEGNYLRARPIGSTRLVWSASASLLQRTARTPETLRLQDAQVWSLSKPSHQYQL